MTLKEQIIAKLEKIKELNIPDCSNESLGQINKLATELIELFKQKEVAIFQEVVCKCDGCKKKREEWQL